MLKSVRLPLFAIALPGISPAIRAQKGRKATMTWDV